MLVLERINAKPAERVLGMTDAFSAFRRAWRGHSAFVGGALQGAGIEIYLGQRGDFLVLRSETSSTI